MRHWRLHWLTKGTMAVVNKAQVASKPAGLDCVVPSGQIRAFLLAAADC
jgi:hypothetical protein